VTKHDRGLHWAYVYRIYAPHLTEGQLSQLGLDIRQGFLETLAELEGAKRNRRVS
jgi:hypothetical protein